MNNDDEKNRVVDLELNTKLDGNKILDFVTLFRLICCRLREIVALSEGGDDATISILFEVLVDS